MSTVTGIGTSFNLPNYHGELFSITPADTPLLSAIGGLTGGRRATAVEFEWSTYDLRDPSQTLRVRTEGAVAPTAEQRARGSVRNVCQIHQEKVEVTYTKQAAIGQFTGPSSAPYRDVEGANAVISELSFQTIQALKSIALDVNYSFINGVLANPTTNGSARQTGGLISSITTNAAASKATAAVTGLSAATDTITETSTARSDGDKIVFTDVGASTTITLNRTYYVVGKTTNAFKVSKTLGGAAITVGTATVAYSVPWTTTLDVTVIENVLQMAYDNGGISEQFTGTLLVNSAQKRAISTAYANAYGKFQEMSRNVGGVNVQTIETNFGQLNVMLDRHVPQDAIIVTSLENLAPVFLEVPGKGVFFEEPLAKTGASDAAQLYGEIGLQYGPEKTHAIQRGLAV